MLHILIAWTWRVICFVVLVIVINDAPSWSGALVGVGLGKWFRLIRQMIDDPILWQFKSLVKWLLGRVVQGKNYILSLALLSLYPMCGNGPLDYLFMFTISIPEAYNGLCRIWFEPKGHQIVGWVLCICGPPTTLIDWGRWINASHFNLGADSPLSVWVWVWWTVYPE